MNITFILKTLNLIGGLEIVTAVLANQFVKDGHNVSIWVFENLSSKLKVPLNPEIVVCYGHGFKDTQRNIDSLYCFLIKQQTDIIINQWGLPYIPIKTIKKIFKKYKFVHKPAIVSVYHSNPSSNGRIFSVDKQYRDANLLQKPLYYLKKKIYKFITSYSMRYVYEFSDAYVVLSECYIPIFKNFIRTTKNDKILSITNPLTIDNKNYQYDKSKKEKILLYVGRLEEVAKRISRVICIWSLLEKAFPDWELVIVGDGPDKDNYQNLAERYQLKNVIFEGYKQPGEYYRRASILILTSEFEGFPLVIPECMSYGVVPVVYGSFPAVTDIIQDGINGRIEPYESIFSEDSMADTVSSLMKDSKKLYSLAEGAIRASINYNVREISKLWYSLFDKINVNNVKI